LKKWIVFLLVVILFVFIYEIISEPAVPNKSAEASPSTLSVTAPSIGNDTVIPSAVASVSSPNEVNNTVNLIYDIKGSLSDLGKLQKKDMDTWRKEVVANVKDGTYKNTFINGPTDNGLFAALTFDDCPDELNTGKILEILDENNIKASFFMIGQSAQKHPSMVKRIYNDGHLVLNHSYSHVEFTKLSKKNLLEQITQTDKILDDIVGIKPAIIRPPYGDINPSVIDTLNKQGLTTVLWSIDSLDWANPNNGNNIIRNVADNVRPGEIILMHCNVSITPEVLPTIIKDLRDKGYNFLTLDEMLGVRSYKD
jgi:peptidoglycan/xylan/chitin deacetylase (PgdA/CDA1 family)